MTYWVPVIDTTTYRLPCRAALHRLEPYGEKSGETDMTHPKIKFGPIMGLYSGGPALSEHADLSGVTDLTIYQSSTVDPDPALVLAGHDLSGVKYLTIRGIVAIPAGVEFPNCQSVYLHSGAKTPGGLNATDCLVHHLS